MLRRLWRRPEDPHTREMVELTLDKMAAGGIYDQVGGGFHRYSTDGRWLVPHFEKMLYDNALLTRLYTHAWQATGEDRYRAVASRTADYLLRELRHGDGGFFSSQDADSEGVEGRFFVWSWDDLVSIAGEPVARRLGATPEGTVPTARGSFRRDDHSFTGFGRAATTDEGRYEFWTLNPGPIDGKAPFFAAIVFARGLPDKLHTRIYLPDHEDLLAADPLLSSLAPDERDVREPRTCAVRGSRHCVVRTCSRARRSDACRGWQRSSCGRDACDPSWPWLVLLRDDGPQGCTDPRSSRTRSGSARRRRVSMPATTSWPRPAATSTSPGLTTSGRSGSGTGTTSPSRRRRVPSSAGS